MWFSCFDGCTSAKPWKHAVVLWLLWCDADSIAAWLWVSNPGGSKCWAPSTCNNNNMPMAEQHNMWFRRLAGLCHYLPQRDTSGNVEEIQILEQMNSSMEHELIFRSYLFYEVNQSFALKTAWETLIIPLQIDHWEWTYQVFYLNSRSLDQTLSTAGLGWGCRAFGLECFCSPQTDSYIMKAFHVIDKAYGVVTIWNTFFMDMCVQ